MNTTAYLSANTRRLHSVGIYVGTTTTQVIFSALEVTNRAPVNQVPRYEFSGREILYQSPVIFTPLTSDRKVDVAQLMSFIDSQYAAAGLARSNCDYSAIEPMVERVLAQELSPLDTFEKITAALPESQRLRLLGEVDHPLYAQLYVTSV